CSGISAEHLRNLASNLLRRYVSIVAIQAPTMSERIDKLARSIAPGGVGERMKLRGPRLQCPLVTRVHVVSSDLQGQVGASESQGRDDALGRVLACEMHLCISDQETDRKDATVGKRDPTELDCAKNVSVPVGGPLWIRDDEMHRNSCCRHA